MFVKPFLKWAGGKYRLLDRILPELPPGTRLVEPFAGSAAVFLNASFRNALICDVNRDLTGLYVALQMEGETFIQRCRSFFTADHNTAETYYALRETFNRASDPRERGALLLYLNRHCYNGLVRYNAKGAFNVPFGRHKKPYFPLAEMRAFSARSGNGGTEFRNADFREVFRTLRPGDVVYCDPPYTPLSRTADFTAYAATAFGEQDQRDLADLAHAAREKGIPVIVSNHDTEQTRALYRNARLVSFDARRFISCRARGSVAELLAVYD